MIQVPEKWLSGFVIIESKMVGSERRLTMDFWLPQWLIVYFRIRLLDKHEDEIVSETGNQEFDISRQAVTSAAGEIPFGNCFERAKEIFRRRQFRRVRIRSMIPESAYKDAVYFVLDVAEVSREDTLQTCDKPWFQQPNCIHLQTDRRNLQKNGIGHGAMFLLMTQEQVRLRIEEIVEKFPRLRWQDRFTVTALANLWRRMFNGKDSPLITSRVTTRRVFRMIIAGATKFAKKNAFTRRGKRKSDRFERAVFLEDATAPEYDPADPGPGFVDPHQLEIAQKHIEEIAGDMVQAEVLTGQIQGETVAAMARNHGLDVRNTQVRISRSRKQLCLPPRRKEQLPE